MLDGNPLVLELTADDGAGSSADRSKAPVTAQARLGSKVVETLGASNTSEQGQSGTKPPDTKKTSAQPGRSDVYVYPESVKAEAQPTGSPLKHPTLLPSVVPEPALT